MLRSLQLRDVGPADELVLELGERLNVLTGDNGLGKSFVLEAAWWALTGVWAERTLWARLKEGVTPSMEWETSGRRGRATLSLDQTWGRGGEGSESTELVVYAGVNHTFAVWDAARTYQTVRLSAPDAYRFDAKALWYGLDWNNKRICNGLIQDWVTWQLEADAGRPQTFGLLRDVLASLSHPDEPMTPGEPERLFLGDSRKYPVIDLPYGKIPILHTSAGMQRILELSYLLTWSWIEHVAACRLLERRPAARLVFLMDEVESHLHPKWQRYIVPRLLGVLSGLSEQMKPQAIVTTHSPLALASIEPHFNASTDKLFLFELHEDAVTLRDYPWTKYGDATGWLTSNVFDLERDRSVEAERALRAAYDYMEGRRDTLPKGLRTERAIHKELTRLLPAHDPFWAQWLASSWRDKG